MNMSTPWLRFAFSCELLLSVIAVFTLWGQVVGPGHLEIMPWYWKLTLGGAASIAVVGLTRAMVVRPNPVNHHSVVWATVILALMAGMGAVTYYYHLHELVDEPETEEDTAARVAPPAHLR